MADPSKPPPPPRRFKTRAGIQRKTAEERAAFIQAEQLRQANQSQSPSSQPQHDTGRRTGLSQREPRTRNENTGGVFSATGAATSSRTKGTHAVSGVEELVQAAEGSANLAVGAEGSRKVKGGAAREEDAAGIAKRPAGKPAKATAKKDEVIYVPDDEAEGIEGKAVDIEDIDRTSISSGMEDDEDDDIVLSRRRLPNRTPKPNLGLRPVRAARDPHSRGEDDPSPVSTKARRKGKAKEAIEIDADQGDKMDLDHEAEHAAIIVEQTSPPPDEEKATLPSSQSPTKRRRKSTTKEANPQFETIEERAERERYTTELRKLRNELSASTDHAHEDAHLGTPTPQIPQEGRLYLFQFPPLTPMLINPDHHHHPNIKPEPNPDANVPAAAPPDPQIKKETDTAQPTTTTTAVTTNTKLLTAANTPPLPAGLAGRLDVHRSGKVTLEWGNAHNTGTGTTATTTNLEVKWGAEVDFLQDVVVLGEDAGDGEGEEKGKGERKKAWALRQVRNKFVVVPDWERIYE
jgi:RNA polymerase III RPC4